MGRVRSVDRIVPDKRCANGRKLTGAMMKLRLDKDGYPIVHIRLNGKGKIWKVHRLVAEYFIENPNKYSEVDHINGFRNDNRVDNLRWCTSKQNANFELAREHKSISVKKSYDKFRGLREKRALHFSKITSKKVSLFKDGLFLKDYKSQRELARELNIPESRVSLIARGLIKNYNGYTIKRK